MRAVFIRSGCCNSNSTGGEAHTANTKFVCVYFSQSQFRRLVLETHCVPRARSLVRTVCSHGREQRERKQALRDPLLGGHSSHSWGFCSHDLITFQGPRLQIPSHGGLSCKMNFLGGGKSTQSAAQMSSVSRTPEPSGISGLAPILGQPWQTSASSGHQGTPSRLSDSCLKGGLGIADWHSAFISAQKVWACG